MKIPETMNAVVLHGADDMQVERRPVPEPAVAKLGRWIDDPSWK